jgi:hypothetical protein
MNNEKMEPCPGCGLVGERYVRVTRAGCRDRVECICGWQGSVKSSRDEARDAWNLRTDPQREAMRKALAALLSAYIYDDGVPGDPYWKIRQLKPTSHTWELWDEARAALEKYTDN